MSAKDKVAEAIREFDFSDYGMDDVAYGLREHPDDQEWVPALAAAILNALDAQPYHTVNLREDGWTLKHPLDCRDQLFDCEYNNATGALDGIPESGAGVYRVSLGERGWLVIEEKVSEA